MYWDGPGRHPGTRPNISESHREIVSTRVPLFVLPQALDGAAVSPAAPSMPAVAPGGWAEELRLRPAQGGGAGLRLRLDVKSGAIVSLVECA